MISDLDVGWLAGIVDGEGCIYIYHNNSRDSYGLKLCVQMTCKETIKRIKAIFSTGEISPVKKEGNRKDAWLWIVNGIDVPNILNLIKVKVLLKELSF